MAASLTGTLRHATGTRDARRPYHCRRDRVTQLVPAGDAPAAARDKRCPPLPAGRSGMRRAPGPSETARSAIPRRPARLPHRHEPWPKQARKDQS